MTVALANTATAELYFVSIDDRKTRKKANGNGEVLNGESEVHTRDGVENNMDQRHMMHMKGLREQQDMILHRRK